MEVLRGPWAELALLLRHIVTESDGETNNLLPLWLFVLLLFLSVCVLLLQLITYLRWKLREVEAELSVVQQDRSSIYRQMYSSTQPRRRSIGCQSQT